MLVRDLMSSDFNSISLNATLNAAAMRMRDMDVGMMPVEHQGEIVGAVTDRDLVVRAIASGMDPMTSRVCDAMSREIFVCVEEDDLEHAVDIMERYQIRRLMVQDARGAYVGILSLADVAQHRATHCLSAEILEKISKPVPQRRITN